MPFILNCLQIEEQVREGSLTECTFVYDRCQVNFTLPLSFISFYSVHITQHQNNVINKSTHFKYNRFTYKNKNILKSTAHNEM